MNIIQKISSFFSRKNKPIITEYPVFSPNYFGTPNIVDLSRKVKFIRNLDKEKDLGQELMAMDYTRITKIIDKTPRRNK
jgi:hypothetical protein